MGDFERRPDTMLSIVNIDGRYYDKIGREVNNRGYLIDEEGNIINQINMKVIGRKQLSPSGELPI
jgi:hypothetical protein